MIFNSRIYTVINVLRRVVAYIEASSVGKVNHLF